MKTVNVSSHIPAASYSLQQGNEAECCVVNKQICLKDTTMEFELKTELDFKRLSYKETNINYFFSHPKKKCGVGYY